MILVRVARIIAPFGVTGQLRLSLTTDHPEWLRSRPSYLVVDPRTNEFVSVNISSVLQRGHDTLVNFRGFNSPESLKQFNGMDLVYPARRGELPREEGEVFFFELPGLEVRSPDGEVFGSVVEVSHSGAHVVLEIEGHKQLIPFIAAVVPEVNLPEGYLVTTYPLETAAEREAAEAKRKARQRHRRR